VQGFDDARGVGNAIEEIRIAEGNVLRTGFDLLTNVGKHNFLRNDAELAVVNRNNWTVATEVFAAARSLGVARGAVFSRRQNHMGIFAKSGQARAIRDLERKARNLGFSTCRMGRSLSV
jgi:hypothetical protein